MAEERRLCQLLLDAEREAIHRLLELPLPRDLPRAMRILRNLHDLRERICGV